ncbi:MAG TPA: hypothetical protein VFA60_07135 [Terriglobales bacterium]|nr:hypothetical protein [Terriglobales bacterium]
MTVQTLGIARDAGREPPPMGIRLIALLSAALALYLAATGALLWAGRIWFSWGAPLLFTMEVAGPGAFFAGGAMYGVNAYGLFRRRNWARRLTFVLALAGAVMAIPDVSAAVAYVQLWRIVRTGGALIARVVVIWYLSQEGTRDAFGPAQGEQATRNP